MSERRALQNIGGTLRFGQGLDASYRLRHIFRMEDFRAALLARIDSRLKHLGMTERAASMAATGKPDLIRFIRARGVTPSSARLAALAEVLGVSTSWLAGDGAIEATEPETSRLRQARIAAGFQSTAEAAKEMGWGEAGYRHHENGTRGFGVDEARVYAAAFRVSAAWLLGLDNVPERMPKELIINGVRYVRA